MSAIAGTGTLIRLILRRDRVLLPTWITLLALLVVATAASFARLYPTLEARQQLAAQLAGNAAITVLLGTGNDLTSVGGLVAWRMGVAGPILAGLMSLITVIRHTRAEEQAGRKEWLTSAAIGRHAPLLAALLVTLGANTSLALLVGLGLVGQGLPLAGSLALGVSLGGAGWIMGGAAAVAAQVAESPGTARGLAGAVLAAAYAMRAVGDATAVHGGGWLTWLSPLGLVQHLRPFGSEQWWVVGLLLLGGAALAATAFALAERRDLGAGLFATRSGPSSGASWLATPLALTWRLGWTTLAAWCVAATALAVALGSLTRTVVDILRESPQLQAIMVQLGGVGGLVDTYFATCLAILAEVVAIYVIQVSVQPRSSELDLQLEPLLAAPVGRRSWLVGHVSVVVLGPVVILGAFGLATGISYGAALGDLPGPVPRLVEASLAYAPALWVFGGLGVALFGTAPRLCRGAWLALALAVLLDLLGELKHVSPTVQGISPFSHVPKILSGESGLLPLVQLAAVAALLTGAGILGFQRRDVG